MAHSTEDQPKYSSFWDYVLHLKWTFPDLACEQKALPTSPTLPNEFIISHSCICAGGRNAEITRRWTTSFHYAPVNHNVWNSEASSTK